MAKTAKSKKAKGKALEKEIAKRLNDVLSDYYIDAKPMPMSGAIDGFKGDIFTNLDLSIEAKNQERLNFRESWKQAKRQAGHKIPILATSKNYDPEIICLINFEDLLFFIELAVSKGWSGLKRKPKK